MEGGFPDDDDDFEAELARELALLGEITPEEIAAAQAGFGDQPYLGPRIEDDAASAPEDFLEEPAERADPAAAMKVLAAALRGDAAGEDTSWDPVEGGGASSAWGAYIGRGREKEEALEVFTLSVAEGRSAFAAILIPERDPDAGALMVEGIEGYDVTAAGDGDVGERKAALYQSRAERALQQREEDEALATRRAAAAAEREEARRMHEEAARALQVNLIGKEN